MPAMKESHFKTHFCYERFEDTRKINNTHCRHYTAPKYRSIIYQTLQIIAEMYQLLGGVLFISGLT